MTGLPRRPLDWVTRILREPTRRGRIDLLAQVPTPYRDIVRQMVELEFRRRRRDAPR